MAALWAVVTAALTAPIVEVPLAPTNTQLDYSWLIGLAMASERHLHWGSQLIFTYGPLGFLNTTTFIYFSRWLPAALFMFGVHILFIAGLAALLWRTRAMWWVWIAATVLLVGPLALGYTTEREGSMLALLVLILAIQDTGRAYRRDALTAAAALLLAVLSLIKTTTMIEACALLAVFAALCLTRQRVRTAIVGPACYLAALFGLWLASGQLLGDVPAFLQSAWSITVGYTPAMSKGSLNLLAAVCAITVLAVPVGAVIAGRSNARPLLDLLCLLTPILLIAFKEGFVRADTSGVVGHTEIFVTDLLIAALIVAIVGGSTHVRHRSATGYLGVAAWAAAELAALLLLVASVGFRVDEYPDVVRSYPTAWHLLTDRASRDSLSLQTYQGLRANLTIPLADLQGVTVDIQPWDIVDAYAYSLAWDPRPVLQTYSAYTPYLDGRDADFLESSSAPQRILYVFEEIDARYLPFDEPRAFRTLLDRYDTLHQVDDHTLVLERRATQVSQVSHREGRECAHLGSPIPVPQVAGRYVFASITVASSLKGSVESVLFKPAPLTILLQSAGVPTTPNRFVGGVAQDGLFVSSYIGNAADMASVFRGQPGNPIQSIVIDSSSRSDYTQTVCADFVSSPAPG